MINSKPKPTIHSAGLSSALARPQACQKDFGNHSSTQTHVQIPEVNFN